VNFDPKSLFSIERVLMNFDRV